MRVFVGFTVDVDSEAYRKAFKFQGEDVAKDVKDRVVEDFVEMLIDQGVTCQVVMVS